MVYSFPDFMKRTSTFVTKLRIMVCLRFRYATKSQKLNPKMIEFLFTSET